MEDEIDFLKLPIEERCQHKSWKARCNGYEAVENLFKQQTDEKSPEFNKYLGLVKKFVIDTHAAAQEKGLAAVLAYVENAAVAPKTTGEVMSGIVSKCLGSPKANVKRLAGEITLMYIEIEKQEIVQDELMKGLENKNPKIVSASTALLRESLRAFGPKVITVKQLIKALPKLLEDRDKNVREEGKQLAIEIYRWIKDALKPGLQGLKPVQLTELDSEFEKVKGETAVPTRLLRSQQQAKAKATQVLATGDTAEEDVDSGVAHAVDPYDLIEAVEILSKLPKDFYEQCEAKKWQERRDALDNLKQLSSAPKLEAGDYSDLVRVLKKMVSKDTNVVVVALAATCLKNLAVGLRKKFAQHAGQCIPVFLEKFKEKNRNVLTALREAIDAMYQVTTLESVVDDVQAALENKNPQIKAETADFLARCFTQCTPATLNKKLLKIFCVSLTKTLNDSDPTIRENSAKAIGTAMKVVGEKIITPFLQDVDPLKMAKIKEYCEKAEIVAPVQVTRPRASAAPKQPEPAEMAPARMPSAVGIPDDGGSKEPRAMEDARPGTAPVARKRMPSPGARKPGSASVVRSATVVRSRKPLPKGSNIPEIPAPPKKEEFTEPELSLEEALSRAADILPEDVLSGVVSSSWKERQAAVEGFKAALFAMEKDRIPAQVLIRVLSQKPGFKDTNIQVLKVRYEILAYIAANAQISQLVVNSCLSDMVDKIGDPKIGGDVMKVLTAFAEATSLEFVSQEVLELAFAQRNPKNQCEALKWLAEAIKEFSLKVDVKMVIEHLKKALAATNQGVRSAAITVIGVMHMYMGKNLRTFFEDEKNALLQQIDAEIEKVQGVRPPQPTRGVAAMAAAAASASRNQGDTGMDEEESGVDVPAINVQDMLPRTDVSHLMTPTLLTELGDRNWKVRGEALNKLADIIKDAKFIQANLGDMPNVLKARLMDSNKNLVNQALVICHSLGVALGPHCSKHIRTLFPGLLACLGDNKPMIRSKCLECINTWFDACNNLSLFFEGEMMSDALRLENPYLRMELLGWLAEKLPDASAGSVPSSELSLCVPYLFACLEDRNPEVRKKAQDCILPVMMHLGYEPMARATSKLKPASKNTVMPQLEKARGLLPPKPSPTSRAKVPAGRGGALQAKSPPLAGTPMDTLAEEGGGLGLRGRINRSASRSKLASKVGPMGAASAAAGQAKAGKKDEEADLAPPLMTNNMKDQRMSDERALKVLKWNFTTPREEFYQQLRDQMVAASWGRTLVSYCFHNDFKFHIKAIDILIECLGNVDATIANLDLILKWLALRFFDTNPSVLLRGLEYMQQLFPVLANHKYILNDAEANSFLPYLVLKSGDPKDSVRKGVREIFKQICKTYPAGKLFGHLLQGLATKNARQRAECLEEMCWLIEMYSIAVCQPSATTALKEIARQIADRDNGVRNAALNCVVQAYFLDDRVLKNLGQLSDKDMGLLEERIKRAAKGRTVAPAQPAKEPPHEPLAAPQPQPQTPQPPQPSKMAFVAPQVQATSEPAEVTHRPGAKSQTPRPKSGPLTLDTEDIEKMFESPEPKTKIPIPTASLKADEILNLPDIKLPRTSLRPPASAVKLVNSSAEATTALNIVMAQLAAQDIPVVVEAFAQVEEVLKQEDKAEGAFGPRVDQLLLMGALQYRLAHNKHMADENICRADVMLLYRRVTGSLVALFEHKTLPKKASRDVLRDLIPHLVTVMQDDRLSDMHEGPQVVRSINVLIMRILQRSNPTHVMSALIKLLHDCVGSVNTSERYLELIMKCLWKMIRNMESYVNELNLDRILLDIHVFLKTYPMPFWKEHQPDTPLRTIKTIVYTLVKLKGSMILANAMMLPNKDDSELIAYLQKVLKAKSAGRPKSGSGSQEGSPEMAQKHQVESSRPLSAARKNENVDPMGLPGHMGKHGSPPFRLSKNQHEALTDIFKKIGSKEHTNEGLEELYEFIKQHPEADIEPFLRRSSDFFQSYIRQGLKNIEQERGRHQRCGSSSRRLPLGSCMNTEHSSEGRDGPDNIFGGSAQNDSSDIGSLSHRLPPLPPESDETTAMDWVEWLKAVAARIGVDGSMYDDPAFLEELRGRKEGEKEREPGPLSQEEMEAIRRSVEETKNILESIKQRCYKEMCV